MRTERPGMQFAGSVVVLAAAFPHAKVRRTIRSLHVEDEVLHERHLVCREDNLQHHTLTLHSTIIYFASAALAADSNHMTVSSSASWSRFRPPSNFVNGHVSTMWFMVCRWPQSEEDNWARPHVCKLARHGPWPVQKRHIAFNNDTGRPLFRNCQIPQHFSDSACHSCPCRVTYFKNLLLSALPVHYTITSLQNIQTDLTKNSFKMATWRQNNRLNMEIDPNLR